MTMKRRWIAKTATGLFALALLYPFSAFLAHIGPWQWDENIRRPALASVRVSVLLTGVAMAIIVVLGTPVAAYIARSKRVYCTLKDA